jgi:hypothetical protein
LTRHSQAASLTIIDQVVCETFSQATFLHDTVCLQEGQLVKNNTGTIEEIACVCCGVTRHTIRGSFQASWEDKDNGIRAEMTYDLLQCNGCQRGTLRETGWFSEEPEAETVTTGRHVKSARFASRLKST